MRTLNRYIVWDYLVIFLVALFLITFVMSVAAMLKAVDLMARGVSPALIGKFFLLNVPYILSFSMPISTLFSALLLFGRLSTDSEISAMKSCGISLWRLASPLILLSILFSLVCIYINCEVAPAAKTASRELLRTVVGVTDPVSLLEEGRFIRDFPGLMIYVGRKNGTNVNDIIAYQMRKTGEVKLSVRAKSGDMEVDTNKMQIVVKLYDGVAEQPNVKDPHDTSKITRTPFKCLQLPFEYGDVLKGTSKAKKRSQYRMGELITGIRNVERDFSMLSEKERLIQRTRLIVEANQRISIALGCFSFMLIGIPLGVKSHRKETSAGLILSMVIVVAYYLCIVVAKSLANHPEFHPNLILWFPLLTAQIYGLWLIKRSS